MSAVLDLLLVGLVLLASAGYAVLALGPRTLRPRAYAALSRLLSRAPGWLGLEGIARRLAAASGGAGGAGGGAPAAAATPADPNPRAAPAPQAMACNRPRARCGFQSRRWVSAFELPDMNRRRELFAGEFRGALAAEGEHPFHKVVGIAELG